MQEFRKIAPDMKKVFYLVVLILFSSISQAQQTIVFEKQLGIQKKRVLPNLWLFQNDINLVAQDTTLSIFNLYYSPDSTTTYGLNLPALLESKTDVKKLMNDILITAIPLVKPGEKLSFTKLSTTEIKNLNIADHTKLLSQAIPVLYSNITSRNYSLPSIKTMQYDLVIKVKNEYLKVNQPVVVLYYIIYPENAYFPNQFKDGVLNVGRLSFAKEYAYKDFEKIASEVKQSYIWNELTGRVYIAKIDTSYSLNPIYHYWEFLGRGPRMFSIKNRTIGRGQPVLGNFQFLEKVGIINCTLDFFLKSKWAQNMGECCWNEPASFKIISINSLDPKVFRERYKKMIAQPFRFEASNL